MLYDAGVRDVVAPCPHGRQRLEVIVIGDDEHPLRDLAVQLRDGDRAQDDRTCAQGHCAFDGVPPDVAVRLSLVELDADAWELIATFPLRPDLVPGTAGAWRSGAAPVDTPPTTHTIAAGECLLRIGYERGVLPETIWSYRPNAAVWSKYHDKAIVSPGLVMQIPPRRLRWIEVRGGQLAIIHRIGVPIMMSIRVVDPAGRPYARCRYVLMLTRAGGEALPHSTGLTDDRGVLCATAEPDVVHGSLIVEPRGSLRRWRLALDIGTLGPANEPGGAYARLENLGLPGHDRGASSTGDALAVVAVADRELDDAAASKLIAAHRS